MLVSIIAPDLGSVSLDPATLFEKGDVDFFYNWSDFDTFPLFLP